MTTISMQPGERDAVTEVLAGIVAGLTLGLVDLSPTAPEPGSTPSGQSGRTGPCLVEDRERE